MFCSFTRSRCISTISIFQQIRNPFLLTGRIVFQQLNRFILCQHIGAITKVDAPN